MVPTKNLDIRCRHDFVTNAGIHHITNQPPLSSIIKSRRLTFFGFSGEACKKSGPIEMPFEVWIRLDPINHVYYTRAGIPYGNGHIILGHTSAC